MQDSLLELFSHSKSRLLDADHKNRTYYVKKTAAEPLVPKQYCLLLNPLLMTQNDFAAKSCTIWLSLYKITKVLTKSNYLIRKIGTPYTQCVHRIGLRPITPNYDVKDISVTQQDFKPDPSFGKYRYELEIFVKALENYTNDVIIEMSDIAASENNQKNEVEHTIGGVITPAATKQPAPAGTAEPAAIIRGTDTVPPFSPPPAPGSANKVQPDDDTFPEPDSRTDMTQVHATSSQLFPMTERNIPKEHDDGATLPTEKLTCQGMTMRRLHVSLLAYE